MYEGWYQYEPGMLTKPIPNVLTVSDVQLQKSGKTYNKTIVEKIDVVAIYICQVIILSLCLVFTNCEEIK